jgi:hypothetical protein
LNVWALNGSCVLIPQTTIGGPWLFLQKSTCKRVNHCTACVGLQVGRYGVEELLSIMSPAWNHCIHCRHAGARGLPAVGSTIDCGIYPAASTSLERRGAEDFQPVCWGTSGAEDFQPVCWGSSGTTTPHPSVREAIPQLRRAHRSQMWLRSMPVPRLMQHYGHSRRPRGDDDDGKAGDSTSSVGTTLAP